MSLTFDPQWLLNFGVLGVVLAWFMFRYEKMIAQNTKATERLSNLIEKLVERIDKK